MKKRFLPLALVGVMPALHADRAQGTARYLYDRNKRGGTTFLVTTLADSGSGSLRDAIDQANATPGADEIRFDVTGVIPVGATLHVFDDVRIVGPGADLLALDGGGVDRIFNLFDPDIASSNDDPELFVTSISGLTLANGQAPYYTYNDTRYFYDGGAILALETDLTLDNVRFEGNYGAGGGAVYFRADLIGDLPEPPTVTVRDCVFEDNIAILGGGGIVVADTGRASVIEGSRFSGNTALLGLPEETVLNRRIDAGPPVTPSGLPGLIPGGGGFTSGDLDHEVALIDSTFDGNIGYLGGAIRSSAADGGGLRIERSTLSGNIGLFGGGVGSFYIAETSQMHVFNSTMSGNTARVGGAFAAVFIYPGSDERKLVFDHVTMAENITTQDPGAFFLYDARLDGTTPIVEIGNSVIADNLHMPARRGLEPATMDLNLGIDVAIEANHSAFQSSASADLIDVGTGNLFGVDDVLTPLLDDLGPTAVHLPRFEGPLHNAADPSSSRFTIDQRGRARTGGGRSDIGAVEGDSLGLVPRWSSDPAIGATFRFRSLETVRVEAPITVVNLGDAVLQLSPNQLLPPFAASITGPLFLQPGESIVITLSCTPISNGMASTTFEVATNDAAANPASFPIECGAVGSALPVPLLDGRPWQVLAALLLAIAGFRFGQRRGLWPE